MSSPLPPINGLYDHRTDCWKGVTVSLAYFQKAVYLNGTYAAASLSPPSSHAAQSVPSRLGTRDDFRMRIPPYVIKIPSQTKQPFPFYSLTL
jgi:hypothetical protein